MYIFIFSHGFLSILKKDIIINIVNPLINESSFLSLNCTLRLLIFIFTFCL
jgi:hypothetical protein